jgi:peptidoglycan L-alanyl-D-glutamate endopeptidase CwlK
VTAADLPGLTLFNDPVFARRFLIQAGLFDGDLNAAKQAFIDQYEQIKSELGVFDDRSEAQLRTLTPDTQRAARELLNTANDQFQRYTVKILSGTRTYAEQDALYAQGRTKPGNVVTKAKGGFSNHNFGVAFDVGIFDGKRYLDNGPAAEAAYKALAKLRPDELDWGGNWISIQDNPHYQLKIASQNSSVLREKFEAGIKFA